MNWVVEFDEAAQKQLSKLDKQLQRNIIKYLKERIATKDDPRRFGKPLAYDKYGLWRYRVGNARIVCSIEDNQLLVLVVQVGHRSTVYNF